MLLRSDRRALYSLYLIAFIDLFAVSLFLPLLSKEIKDLGGDPLLIGVIGSVYGAVQLVSSPIVGWSSDKYGSKLVLFFCLALTALAYALQGYSATLFLFLISRSIAGCFKHTQTIGKSIISDLCPREKSQVLGNFNAFGSMGFIIGPTIGAHLVESEGGFQSVCLLASVSFVVNIVILLIFVSSRRKQQKFSHKDGMNGSSTFTSSMSSLLPGAGGNQNSSSLRYSVFGLLVLRFLFSSSTIIPRANLPLILEAKYGTQVVAVGYLNSLQALVSTLTGFAVGPVVLRFYKNDSSRMVKAAGVLKTLSLLALVVAPNFRLAGLTMLIQSGADPFLRVGITSMSLEGHDDPGTILGLGQTATSLSRMIAPFAAGLAQTFSEDGPAVVGSFAALLGLILAFFISYSSRHLHSHSQHQHQHSLDKKEALT